MTFAQTWDVSYGADEDVRPAPRSAAADLESACCPSIIRQVLLAIGPQSARAARDFTKATLREWGLPDLAPEATLIASELVTNAIMHGACGDAAGSACGDAEGSAGDGSDRAGEPGRVELSWQRQAGRVICRVTDRSPRPPVLGSADSDAESGRGLQVVAALAAAWGWTMTGVASKAVWAALSTLPHG